MDRGDVAAQGVSSHMRPVSKKKSGSLKASHSKIANYKPPFGCGQSLQPCYASRPCTPRSTPVRQSVARVQAVTGCLLLPSIKREQGTRCIQ